MFISPKTAIAQGWVTGIKNEKLQVQPNAIDFTLDRLFTIDEDMPFTISTDPVTGKEKKSMRGGVEISASARYGIEGASATFHLNGKSSFDMLSDVFVNLPEGVAAMTIIRSTFCRNGLFLTSGLYDSGFEGHVGCIVHNNSGEAVIEKGVRIGQIMFFQAEAAGVYSGGYNHGKGTSALHQAVN